MSASVLARSVVGCDALCGVVWYGMVMYDLAAAVDCSVGWLSLSRDEAKFVLAAVACCAVVVVCVHACLVV